MTYSITALTIVNLLSDTVVVCSKERTTVHETYVLDNGHIGVGLSQEVYPEEEIDEEEEEDLLREIL